MTMRIVYEEQFGNQLKAILSFISRDNATAAQKFRDSLKARIEQIPTNPVACRQSHYFNDHSLRDLVFRGYTAIYRIGDDEIRLLDIFRWQER